MQYNGNFDTDLDHLIKSLKVKRAIGRLSKAVYGNCPESLKLSQEVNGVIKKVNFIHALQHNSRYK
eukprot:6193734-Pleurochrysis_carterae.AAC.1